ncbi:MAG: hypothetical protein K2N87_08100 [Eubacterium sp.]|nr:hypothetical protein [Eubacterium sp.]
MIRAVVLFLLALLKFFGWACLILLLLLLVVLLLVVFVPVRYDVLVSNERSEPLQKNPAANLRLRVKVTWLLHLVHVSVSYGEEGLQNSIRAAGIDLKKVLAWFGRRSGRSDEAADSAPEQDSAGEYENTAPEASLEEVALSEDVQNHVAQSRVAQTQPQNEPEQDKDVDKDQTGDFMQADESDQTNDSMQADEAGQIKEPIQETDPVQANEAGHPEKGQQKKGTGKKKRKRKKAKTKQQKNKKQKNKQQKINKQKEKKQKAHAQKRKASKTDADSTKSKPESEPGIFTRLRSMYERLRREVTDEANRHALSRLFAELLGLLKSYKPRKLRAEIAFSLANPAWTGEAVGILSLMPWVYRHPCSIEPDFTSEKLYVEGEIEARGKVTVCVFLLSLLRLVRDKEFMRVVRRLLKRNGASKKT